MFAGDEDCAFLSDIRWSFSTLSLLVLHLQKFQIALFCIYIYMSVWVCNMCIIKGVDWNCRCHVSSSFMQLNSVFLLYFLYLKKDIAISFFVQFPDCWIISSASWWKSDYKKNYTHFNGVKGTNWEWTTILVLNVVIWFITIKMITWFP